jgi:hypothetical protein
MTIEPDDKDWTWVLSQRCPECGVTAGQIEPERTGELVRYCADRFTEVLRNRSTEELRSRPAPDRWSALEYACHMRDVFRLFDVRLASMLDEDDPLFANWDQDVTAVDDRYDLQDPVVVAGELAAAGAAVAASFDRVSGDRWDRPGRRSDGASFTVRTFAQYFVHDPLHHLVDIGLTVDDRPGTPGTRTR